VNGRVHTILGRDARVACEAYQVGVLGEDGSVDISLGKHGRHAVELRGVEQGGRGCWYRQQ
jgi:hypothetical protein